MPFHSIKLRNPKENHRFLKFSQTALSISSSRDGEGEGGDKVSEYGNIRLIHDNKYRG